MYRSGSGLGGLVSHCIYNTFISYETSACTCHILIYMVMFTLVISTIMDRSKLYYISLEKRLSMRVSGYCALENIHNKSSLLKSKAKKHLNSI